MDQSCLVVHKSRRPQARLQTAKLDTIIQSRGAPTKIQNGARANFGTRGFSISYFMRFCKKIEPIIFGRLEEMKIQF
jgi:hypothetical protein